MVVRVDRDGVLLNAARVSADQPDPNERNNVAIELTDANGVESQSVVDLAVTKVASASTVRVGETVTFTVRATNTSPHPATGVIVTDILPQGAVLVSVSPSQGTCTGTGIIECALGTLTGGSSATVTIVARATVAGSFDNVATVVTDDQDTEPEQRRGDRVRHGGGAGRPRARTRPVDRQDGIDPQTERWRLRHLHDRRD